MSERRFCLNGDLGRFLGLLDWTYFLSHHLLLNLYNPPKSSFRQFFLKKLLFFHDFGEKEKKQKKPFIAKDYFAVE
jgi:hypothetical protein